jgi:hypothetical protein
MFSFGRDDGHHVDRFGSSFVLAPLTDPTGGARAACLHLAAGDVIGEHEATTGQLFCVVAGSGWVSGSGGHRTAITAWQAVFWDRGEVHAAGTETGMTAIVLEGDDFRVGARPTGS